MPLTLEVVGQKAGRMGANARKTFNAGGTIGREPDNDWEFPDEYISGHHAKITFAAGIFTITDTSTNGVFINSPQNRLTRGQPYTLHDGDTVYIDDYEVRVTMGVEPSYTTPSVAMDDGFDEPAGVDDTDPLKLLGLGARPAVRGPTAEGLGNKSVLSQNFQPPPAPPPSSAQASAASAGKRMIPQGYNPFAPKAAPEKPAARPVAAEPFQAGPFQAGPIPAGPFPERSNDDASPAAVSAARSDEPDFESLPDAAPAQQRPTPVVNPIAAVRARLADNPRQPRQTQTLEARATPPVQPPVSNGAIAQPSATPAAARNMPARSEMDFAALLAAAGIDSMQVSPELAQQFGQILRTVVAGLMDVLRARDTIKNEFRMRMTTFKQVDNNPLKYSANVEDALFNLLVKRNPAYLGPVEAFDDAFQDVRSHQMSMLAGMRVAYDSMLAAFDPARLQEEFDRQVKSGSFLNSSKSKYWELYAGRFRDMAKDGDATFRKLFGDEFAKAYEEQLARLRTQKRSDRR